MHNKKIIIILSFGLIVLILLFILGIIPLAYPDRSKYPIRGIDVSHHQGNIDWRRVANSDVKFAYIKATEADNLEDRLFKVNLARANDAGLITGAYHFYSLAYNGEIQANNFVSVVGTTTNQLPPVIDLEYVGNSKKRPSKQELQKELNIYINFIENKYNQKPIIYTTYSFYNDYLYPEFKEYDLWIRDLIISPNKSVEDNWLFWQYDAGGKVDGINGPVDLNVFRGSSVSLDELISKIKI